MALLELQGLSVRFQTNDAEVRAVNDVTLSVDAGETLGIVGESGSGKSQLSFAIMGLLARNGRASGSVLFDGQQILNAPPKVLNRIRAEQIAMIFQDPMTSLNPYMRVADQMAEVLTLHKGLSKRDAVAQAVQMLDAVKIPDARGRVRLYPHEFSGGMRQRVMIALALACRPRLLLADEPTTALDATVQIQILLLLRELQREFGMGVIFVTHDIGVAVEVSERIAVMYAGQIVEEGTTREVIRNPRHPYTQGLLAANLHDVARGARLDAIPGAPPSLEVRPDSCSFAPRCPMALPACRQALPPVLTPGPRRRVACLRAGETLAAE